MPENMLDFFNNRYTLTNQITLSSVLYEYCNNGYDKYKSVNYYAVGFGKQQ